MRRAPCISLPRRRGRDGTGMDKQRLPRRCWVHGALILTQVLFGAGGVVGALAAEEQKTPSDSADSP